jgi:tetratricopeptide (TPR) repeat protein
MLSSAVNQLASRNGNGRLVRFRRTLCYSRNLPAIPSGTIMRVTPVANSVFFRSICEAMTDIQPFTNPVTPARTVEWPAVEPSLLAILTALFFGLLACGQLISAQEVVPNWLIQVRADVKKNDFIHALNVTEHRIANNPSDLEAHGWRGRLLAWTNRWPEAETEYRHVLSQKPDDVDMITGLADLLQWQLRSAEALQLLDRARALAPDQSDILVRRKRVLACLRTPSETPTQSREPLVADRTEHEPQVVLASLPREFRHELRIGTDIDFFNYTSAASAFDATLNSRWNRSWSTTFAVDDYQRFGELAAKFTGKVTRNLGKANWLSAGSAVAHDAGIIPRAEAFFEYGHGMRLHNPLVRGLETSYDQHWFWYRNATILTLGGTGLLYLPRDWTWSLSISAARSGFSTAVSEWQPNGHTRLGFPLWQRLSGNISFGVGSESFAQIDQTGHFAGRTFAGGLRYKFTDTQDVSGYVACQDRSQGRSQTTVGANYGFRF